MLLDLCLRIDSLARDIGCQYMPRWVPAHKVCSATDTQRPDMRQAHHTRRH
jgi:hypothetical protein